ncbi:MAG: Rne/Rng family ribonuclease [Paludibacteraceae bacterium]|nr:Rne/Rng family ribonuclease [Paludibacteraceae bacterium]
MKSELVVDVQKHEITIALLEDGRLAELNKEKREQTYSVGNIYYGRVKKIMPGLNAAFVDVGYQKEAFLHYLDLGTRFNTQNHYVKQVISNRKRLPHIEQNGSKNDLPKDGQLSDVLKVGQQILVQIVKEPISTKGPRLTAEISLAGRYMVLIPMSDQISISSKIKKTSERTRLHNLMEAIKPKGYGVIVRTVALGKQAAELDAELKTLIRRWEDAMRILQKAEAPALISEEHSRTIALLRDIFNPSFDHIYVNDQGAYEDIRQYVSLIAQGKEEIVELYKGELPILDKYGVTRQMKVGMGRTVSYKKGAYLIIEHTEALHVIDVNSGNRTWAEGNQDENAYEVNLAAADEIAHQLRLRDMGGIIVVDFIDMHQAEHREGLYTHMREVMANDRAKHNILPLSKFGLMQITRQRVRPVVEMNVSEKCPTCMGSGKIQTSLLLQDDIEEKISYLRKVTGQSVIVHVNPYVYAYIKQGWPNSIKSRWRRKYKKIKIIPSEILGFLEYHFYDEWGNGLDTMLYETGSQETVDKSLKIEDLNVE